MYLNYRDSKPIYTQICDSIRQQIISGVLLPGDKLPSVRELASQKAINPNTIQRAYRELELAGWIASVPGKGSFVSGIPSPRHTDPALWEDLNRAAAALLALGVSKEELIQHLQKGESNDA